MTFDLKITGGKIYDGDGGEPVTRQYRRSKDGNASLQIGACDGAGRNKRVIDAKGAIVTRRALSICTPTMTDRFPGTKNVKALPSITA